MQAAAPAVRCSATVGPAVCRSGYELLQSVGDTQPFVSTHVTGGTLMDQGDRAATAYSDGLSKGKNIMRNLGIKAIAVVLLSAVTFGAFAQPRHYRPHHRHHHHHPVVVIHR
jgi:hypothetical protein